MEPLPRIPGYEMIEPLGGGPFTVVWSGIDFAGRRVAVKLPRRDSGYSKSALTLLQREALVATSVAHPHLIRVRDNHTHERPYFLAMDLLPGESLRARLRREYRLSVNSAIWIARQVAEALSALHLAGFVHGDVKPDNVRLTGAGAAVLIDLGFAHRPGENAEFLERGLILGTANYLAPEICDLNANADGRADLFSLGVMIYELLTGELPFEAAAMAETLRAHLKNRPADLRDQMGPWPPALPRLLRRLLARHPANRPHSAELIRELTVLEIASMRSRAA